MNTHQTLIPKLESALNEKDIYGREGWEEDWSKREFELTFNFDDINELIKFLTEYDGWYDLNN
jgi:ATP-dependent helicase/DNAse subunit B